MEIGESIKVWLPGETPWATVEAIHNHELVEARIDNFLFHQWPKEERMAWVGGEFGEPQDLPKLHDYKCDDLVLFKLTDGVWMAQQKVSTQ